MAIDYRSTTSLPALGAAPLPTTQVGQYINQQISGATNRADAQRNAWLGSRPLTPQTTGSNVAVADNGLPKMATENLVGNTVKMIEDTNAKVASYRFKPNETGSSVGPMGFNPNAVPAGKAWTSDGKLSPTRNNVLSYASTWLGKPYLPYQMSSKGTDCSGLVMMVYNKFGMNVKVHSATWQRDNIPGVRTSVSNLRPGDIVAWKDGSHIAIYAGNGEIIEAANSSKPILRRKLWASPNDVIGIALRLPGE